MNPKNMYYRRKEGGIVIEGKTKEGKNILITTLPRDPNILLSFMIKESYFNKEKSVKINQKIDSLLLKSQRRSKGSPKVRTTNLTRSSKNDYEEEEEEGEFDSPEELIKELEE